MNVKKIVYIRDFVQRYRDAAEGFVLSPQRQARMERLSDDAQKLRFRTAEYLTTMLLRKTFCVPELQIQGEISKKPYIPGREDISFSRSYCESDLLIAIEDDGSIGSDCEKIKMPDDAVMKYFFTEGERSFVCSAEDRDLAFTLIWTRKESYMKCIGEGLCGSWALLDVTPHQMDWKYSPISLKNDAVGEYFMNSYRMGNTVLSICSRVNDRFPSVIQEWREDEEDNYCVF